MTALISNQWKHNERVFRIFGADGDDMTRSGMITRAKSWHENHLQERTDKNTSLCQSFESFEDLRKARSSERLRREIMQRLKTVPRVESEESCCW